MVDIAVVDYGSGNVRSILNALRRVASDLDIMLTDDPVVVANAGRAILPGVGAFGDCVRKLDASGVLPALGELVAAGRPLLGICVGMQILADEGTEFGHTNGLGWIPGVVRKLDPVNSASVRMKLPHVGWSPIDPVPSTLFEGVSPGTSVYFLHSYVFECSDPASVLAFARYGEVFAAAVVKDSIVGCQFHPEKSDAVGLKILNNFCRWNP